MRLIKKLLWILFLSLMVLASVAVGYYFAVTKDVALQKDKLQLSQQNVLVYDRYGNEIQPAGVFSNKQSTPIEEIPQHTKQAFISVEDKRFYTHGGFDSRRILKAVLWRNAR